jgi:predicted ArsR family transcriptional regulator
MRRVSDAATLRALSHPVRIALIEALTLGGVAMTATELGERIGETPTTCSFHLRQLAKYGWVEEAGGGKGRARPWRMTSIGFETPSTFSDPETTLAHTALSTMFRDRQLDRYRKWLQVRAQWPEEWSEAATDAQYGFYLTAGELSQLSEELHALLTKWFSEARITDRSKRPPGARPVELLALAYPLELPPENEEPGAPGTESGAGDEPRPGDAE